MISPRKPFPLKQRTSSLDQRRDYSTQTWTSVLGILKAREFFVSVDNFSLWRRHVAWATESGKDLRSYMTQRYASSMVFLSLLLSTELNVLFNSSAITTEMRTALAREEYQTVRFWCGITIITSAILTLLSLISTFTAWTMVSAVSAENAHCIFRSSIGQYAAELPGRFIVGAVYSFLLWICLFFFLLLPIGFWSSLLLILSLGLFVHTITAFSSFGRVIMHSGAMSSAPIFEKSYETQLLPHSLHRMLLAKAKANLMNKTSIRRQYMSQTKPLARHFSEDELSGHLSGLSGRSENQNPPPLVRQRTNSIVKFADGVDTNGDPIAVPAPTPPPPPQRPSTPVPFGSLSPLTLDGSHKQQFSTATNTTQGTTARPFSPRPPASPKNSTRRPPLPLSRKQSTDDPSPRQSPEELASRNESNGPISLDEVSNAPARSQEEFIERWIQQQNREESWPQEIMLENSYPLPRPSLWSNSDLTTTSSLELSEEDANDRFERQFGDLFDPEKQQLLDQDSTIENDSRTHQYGATNGAYDD